MIVSWNWLKDYVLLDMDVGELEHRLMMSGLNHEETNKVDGDFAIDLEVTNNRPDCLGHIGIAREIATLWGRQVTLPAASPQEGQTKVTDLTQVEVRCPELCPRYTARVIRGVQVGPSPDWMVQRLKALRPPKNVQAGEPSGEPERPATINNVVDVTNYVLHECGQPLHAFDINKLAGNQIIVRQANKGETIEAIDHKTYTLAPGMCVIADAQQPVAIAGIMGGAGSEVSDQTTDLLIEAAEFDPLATRQTRYQLKLGSESSYRFERGVDSAGIDWASRRACELILELAGGELAEGVIDVGAPPPSRRPLVLRLSQIERILGITIPPERTLQILTALGHQQVRADDQEVEVIPPSWRRDLSREIDLVEEVGRIYGYDSVPEDVVVPLSPSSRSKEETVLAKVRHALTALGYHEAMTISALTPEQSDSFSPWSDAKPLQPTEAVLKGADRLRRTLIPSLLAARRYNEGQSNPVIELFESANIYLPQPQGLPQEKLMIGLCSGQEFFSVKGALETIAAELNITGDLETQSLEDPFFEDGQAAELLLNSTQVGVLGRVSPQGLKIFELRQPACVAELWLEPLVQAAELVPKFSELSQFPAVTRDLNIVVQEHVRWSDLAKLARQNAGELLEALQFQEVYRDKKQLGPGKKSLLFSLTFRSSQGTLTGELVDSWVDQVVQAAQAELGGELRGN